MTPTQFIDELRIIRDALEWRITEEQRLLGFLKRDPEYRIFDPVTAVAFFRLGQYFPDGHASEAARAIGLSFDDCVDVVAACHYDWDPSSRQGAVRRDLMKALIAGGTTAEIETPVLVHVRTAITHSR